MSVETLSQLFDYVTTTYNKADQLIYRGKDGNFYNISTNEFKDRVIHFALGLRELGVKPDTKIFLLSENRPEWAVVDFASHLLSAVIVPVFPSLIPEQIKYIVNDSESELIIVSGKMQAGKIFEIRDKLNKVKHIIAMDDVDSFDEQLAFEDILKQGREKYDDAFYPKALETAKPDVIATIIYTSGTTGTPKGVMLTHRNFVSNYTAASQVLGMHPSDKGLSFLPLSHSFERTVDYTFLYNGASIIYSTMDTLAEDLVASAPTIMASVPRFYEKVMAKVEAKAVEEGGLKKKIFDWALKVGYQKSDKVLAKRGLGLYLGVKAWVADMLVFSKIRARTGGSIRYLISGGAPLSSEVARFFHAAGLTILEGYGLTETSPVITINPADRPKFGTVGPALSGVEVKIADDGEILAKGPNIMMGYYKMPEATAEVMDGDWFLTGDIGELDSDGYLKITDRKKQIIVTSTGKNVAPQPIEKAIELSPYIEQVVLIGDKRRFITALIVPEFEALRLFASKNDIAAGDNGELIKSQKITDLIMSDIESRQGRFSEYEQVKKFQLLATPFSIENGQLTPTMKVKRKVVLEKYGELVEKMYSKK